MMIDGLRVPRFLYGTAWKEDDTETLALIALRQGFHGIDTANQRKHYHEAGVGRAIAAAIIEGVVTRDDLFLQTKFTFRDGQDHRMPYDPAAPVAKQVEQSFASSLAHLGVSYVDSYVLHGPSVRSGLADSDREAWRAMEDLQGTGRAQWLGVSNVSLEQLRILWEGARVKPRFVQNRCYASRGWDQRIRQFCTANGILYQGFSLLTANRGVLTHPDVQRIAKRHGCGAEQVVFRFALQVGMIVLTGTTDAEHMAADLDVFDFELDSAEIQLIERIGAEP